MLSKKNRFNLEKRFEKNIENNFKNFLKKKN